MKSYLRRPRSESRLDRGLAFTLVLVSVNVAVLLIAVGSAWSPGDLGGASLWLGLVLGQVGASVTLLYRRRAPIAVGLIVVATAICLLLSQLVVSDPLWSLGGSDDPYASLRALDPWVPFAMTIVVFTVVRHADPRRAWPVWGLIGVLAVLAVCPWRPSFGVIAGGLLFTAVPALIGLYFAARLRLIQALTERAERAEREKHLLAEQARGEERARLAAEMHDVVTHRVSLMVLQAGALRVIAPDTATKVAAEELRAGGCQALEELRDLVGILRTNLGTEQSLPVDESTAVSTLGLAALAEESRSVGVDVELVEDGADSRVSPVINRTVYRIVQEALTNTRKHAPGSCARVQVRYTVNHVYLTVSNTAPPMREQPDDGEARLATLGSGTGLWGLRRRVELVQGELHAQATVDGGFKVEATLPTFVPTAESAAT